MKRTVYADDFVRAFDEMGRSDNFSKAGRYALFDHLMEYEREVGTELDLDVIAFCSEYSEHESALECAYQYNSFVPSWKNLNDDVVDDDDKEEEALEWLEERTTVIPFGGGVIVQNF